MHELPEPPPHLGIRLIPTEEGSVLVWEAYPRERTMALLAAIIAGAGVVGGIAFLGASISRGAEQWQLLTGIGIVALAALTLVACVRLRFELTESLSLADNELLYGKPAPPRVIWRIFGWDDESQTLRAGLALDRFVIRAIGDMKRTLPRKHLVKLGRTNVTDVRVEGRGRFGHVAIVVGKTSLDIGKRLSNEGRLWLVDLVQRWRAA